MPVDPMTALRGAHRSASAGAPVRRLLVAGAIGRLGEALLTEALARGGFDEVVALAEAEATMSLGVRGLSLAPRDALPPLEAALIARVPDADAPGARSFHGRDAPFAAVDGGTLARVAADAAQAGARRLVLVHPMPAWQQMSGVHLGLSGETELGIARLPFESVTVMRPAAQSDGGAGGWLQRIAGLYMSLQFLMLPRSVPVLTSVQIARAAVRRVADAEPGLQVMGAGRIAELLDPERAAR
ncbi:MAG TPA: hypothetical protein VEA81_00790 [Burkholderiaceae bacterium]|nr:hypothetical protein [Burkholderiaceae bacterium]